MHLQLDTSVPWALALEGGGAKGAWQIGAWRALRESGVRISAVAGTSVGALNGAMITMGKLEAAEETWRNLSWSQVMDVDDDTMEALMEGDWRELGIRRLLSDFGDLVRNRGFDVTPLRNTIREMVSEEQVRASDIDFYIVTYSISDREELELRARDLADGELYDMLLASAYLPVFRNERLGGKRYTDGGIRDVLPLHVLVENGYKNILALRLHGFGQERKVEIPEGTQVFMVEPSEDLGSTLEFDPERSVRNLKAGYYDTLRFLYGLKGKTCCVDAGWTEEEAFAFLREAIRRVRPEIPLRELQEKLISQLAEKLEMKDDASYDEIAIALLEKAAEATGTDRWQILTETQLASLCGDELDNTVEELLPVEHSYHRFGKRNAE